MQISIRRNDPCWCGSGKKFKHCHRGRQEGPQVSLNELQGIEKQLRSKGPCQAASLGGCGGPIVRAHTIQRSGGLSKIAQNGHVFQVSLNVANEDATATERLVGYKQASTFGGFCQDHDREIFAPLETKPFVSSKEQCFLLAYRALCRELFEKLATAEFASKQLPTLDRGKSVWEQIEHQEMSAGYRDGTDLTARDLRCLKGRFDDILESRSYWEVESYALELQSTPEVMCSGFFAPCFDFTGQQLQRLVLQDGAPNTDLLSYLAVSVVATDTGGAVVLTWSNGDLPARQFGESLFKISAQGRCVPPQSDLEFFAG